MTIPLVLPEPVALACEPLFAALPLDRAMPQLIGPRSCPQAELVVGLVDHPALRGRPHLLAGLWLYVDDLARSHELSQSLNDATAAFWHGIMHRREGDFDNAKYWMRRCLSHPLRNDPAANNPVEFIDEVRAAGDSLPAELLRRQREEWRALFEWSAANPG